MRQAQGSIVQYRFSSYAEKLSIKTNINNQ